MGYGPTTSVKQASPTVVADRDRADWHDRASALYEELRQPAIGLVRRAYGQTFADDEIEDVYSNAWLGTLRALERRHAELSDEEIRSYLLTAVANHASKEIRRRKRKPVAPLEAAGSVAEVAASPEDQATARESSDITRDLLSSLPPRRRAVMLLRYGWGLEPTEICNMVEGLSPRAYRKEITKGVDDLTERIRLLEQGRWCEQREPVLKAYASGLASDDQALQAERHMSHCRSCSEFVGKLSGHLHDLGSSILLPGALDALDGQASLLDKARDVLDGAREHLVGTVSRSDPSEGVALANGANSAKGAGAAGAGVFAKLSGAGSGAKVALLCAGGAAVTSACVAVVLGPISLPGPPDRPLDAPVEAALDIKDAIAGAPRAEPPARAARTPTQSRGDETPAHKTSDGDNQGDATTQPVVDSETPPVTQEFGVESVAAPVGAPPPQTDSGSGAGAVATEFGP